MAALDLNYICLSAKYVATSGYTLGEPSDFASIVWDGTAPNKAELDAYYLMDYKIEQITAFSNLAKADIIAGFVSPALGYPCKYDSEEEDQINLIGSVGTVQDMFYACYPSTAGYQDITYVGTLDGTSSTGFLNDTTLYNAEIVIDGVSEYCSIMGQDCQTINSLITTINLDLIGKAVISINNGDLRVTSASYQATSTINIIDANLFNTIPGFTGISPAVSGIDALVASKEYRMHTHAQLLQVLQDGRDVKLDILQKFNVKKAQILAAPDVAAVDAIIW